MKNLNPFDQLMKSKVLARWTKIGGLLAVVVIGGAAVLVASRWPFTRDTIVRALQEKFSSTVELKTFHGTYFTPGCVAEGVTFRRNGDRNAPPIATIEKLTIQGSYWGFSRFRSVFDVSGSKVCTYSCHRAVNHRQRSAICRSLGPSALDCRRDHRGRCRGGVCFRRTWNRTP